MFKTLLLKLLIVLYSLTLNPSLFLKSSNSNTGVLLIERHAITNSYSLIAYLLVNLAIWSISYYVKRCSSAEIRGITSSVNAIPTVA